LLSGDKNLSGAVMCTIEEFDPWLEMSGVPFFPEYTDHGPRHIESVLLTAQSLIDDEAWEAITPQDGGVIVLATLLHDSAIHLSEDGFVELVTDIKRPSVPGLNDTSWHLLWNDFLAMASRYDDRRLKAVFGDTEPVRRPALDPHTMSKRDRILIGEFLRPQHHRLAHEIALFGVPGPQTEKIRLQNVPEDMADLAGLVARSHGVSIRSCFDYLRRRYDLREYRRIHPVFLMALLRVSDYLQIREERAPKQLLKVHRLRSPLSRREWKAHLAIHDIRNTHDDPEAIFIQSEPQDVETYLKVKEWLADIQVELDTSWAVLGETYGRLGELSKLGFVLRRVRSNLDDVEAFARTVSYVPCKAAFEAASPDLLKLLIKPFYGDRPEIAIRELVQNSVDAVREFREYQKQMLDLKADLPNQEADVVVSITEDKDGWWLTASDCGIGMTSEVIREYFLKAGATIRTSESWRRQFENEKGKSRVLRSGRFGIGILAAFLLGDEIHVSTRHAGAAAQDGIAFHATLDTETIELQRCARAVGTTIRVHITEQTRGKLERPKVVRRSSWYCLDDPSVLRLSSTGAKLDQAYRLPEPGSPLPSHWHRIKHPDYQDIQWTYLDAPTLTCNGILVSRKRIMPGDIWEREKVLNMRLVPPKVSVFDPDCVLPLTLHRDYLTQAYPFDQELIDDVLRDFIAYVLVRAPSHPLPENPPSQYYEPWYPGFRLLKSPRWTERIRWAPWLWTPNGVSFVHPSTISQTGIKYALIVRGHTNWRHIISQLSHTSPDAMLVCESLHTSPLSLVEAAIRGFTYETGPFTEMNVRGSRILMSSRSRDILLAGKRRFQSSIANESVGNGWVLWRVGDCPATAYFVNKPGCKVPDADYNHPVIVSEVYFSSAGAVESDSRVVSAWRDWLGSPIIPYDLSERHQKLKDVFQELDSYVRAHEEADLSTQQVA
jgi:hypothetical protein